MSLLQRYQLFIEKEKLFATGDQLLLAVSGGVDSVVLCELCRRAGFPFRIAHCNFQLRGAESDRDEEFVKSLASGYNVPFLSARFDTARLAREQKKSIEEMARDLRYAWLLDLVEKEQENGTPAWLLTAHHADDSIETVLMNLFRGTGIRGLHGILPRQGRLVRPLLFARKQELVDYAAAHHLVYVTDSSNAEDLFTRNFFRNRILPAISEKIPQAAFNVLDTIERLREAEQLYQESVDRHKMKMLEERGEEWHIPVLKLKKTVAPAVLLFEIVRDFGFSSQQVPDLLRLLEGETGKYVASSTHRLIRNRKWLVLAPLAQEQPSVQVIDGEGDWEMPGARLEIRSTEKFVLPENGFNLLLNHKQVSYPLIVRKWKPGDYFYPLGMKKKKKLSRFLIDQKLSRTDKEKIRVLEMEKKIIWVLGLRPDERFRSREQSGKWLSLTFIPQG